MVLLVMVLLPWPCSHGPAPMVLLPMVSLTQSGIETVQARTRPEGP
ncbi:MAG: hypothetical protein QUU85_07675 [Candidatus Eisenbacteria bacterium]|nr:hypothetical protein [Candidatus Eisenbacteria bacterium]